MDSFHKVGLIPTLKVLLALKPLILRNPFVPLDMLEPSLLSNYNNTAVNIIITAIKPYWDTLVQSNNIGFNYLYNIYVTGFVFSLCIPFLSKLLDLGILTIITSIFVLYNKTLASTHTGSLIIHYAVLVLTFVKDYTGFELPILKEYYPSEVESEEEQSARVQNQQGLNQELVKQSQSSDNAQGLNPIQKEQAAQEQITDINECEAERNIA